MLGIYGCGDATYNAKTLDGQEVPQNEDATSYETVKKVHTHTYLGFVSFSIFISSIIHTYYTHIFIMSTDWKRKKKKKNEKKKETRMVISQAYELGIASFTANLTKLLSKHIGMDNILISSLNIYNALGLLHLGARSITREELSFAMGLPNEGDL